MELVDDAREGQTREPPVTTAGEWLKYLRGQRRLKGRQLARRIQEVGAWYLGAPKLISSLVSMICRWEKDVVVPESYNIHLLAEALDVPVAELKFPIDPYYVHPPRRAKPLPLD